MIKKYFTLAEAAKHIQSKYKEKLSIRDILDMAFRGEYPVVTLYDGVISVYKRDYKLPEDIAEESFGFKGYITVPISAICLTPNQKIENNVFFISSVDIIEKIHSRRFLSIDEISSGVKSGASELDNEDTIPNSIPSPSLPYYLGFPHDRIERTINDLLIPSDNLNIFIDSTKTKSQKNKDSLSESERNSLLKLVLGMAMSKYDYAPMKDRNDATGENKGSIFDDLSKQSLNLDSDTIRKFIKEAEKRFK